MCTVSICYSNCYISLKVLCQARNRNSYFKAHRCTVPIILCYILLPFVAPYSFFCKNEQYCDWVFSLVVIPRITIIILPSVLWRCWLGGRKGIRPVKNRVVGYWRGYLSGARCRLAYGPADATATHLSLASVKSRLVLPFWYRITRVVPEKGR